MTVPKWQLEMHPLLQVSHQIIFKYSSNNIDTSKIEEALRKGEMAASEVFPYEIPDSLIFRPQEDNVKNSKKVDYLGKSKIVAGAGMYFM